MKFHFKTEQGHKHYTNDEAEQVVGKTRESYQEQLYGTIDKGEFPRWKFQVQVMPEMDAEKTPYNPFDLTKVWPHADYPPIDVGTIELNRNADNYFAEIENAAFSPSNIVPGISFSPDKMLQARIFSYADAHRYRLGTHYETIPVNRPRVEVHNYHKDGTMNVYGGIRSGNENAYYEPNSFDGAVEDRSAQEPPLRISGDAARYDHRHGHDDYSQVRDLFVKALEDDEKVRLFKNIAVTWGDVPEYICERQLAEFAKVHPDYESGVRRKWNEVKAAGGYAPNAAPITDKTPQRTSGDAADGQLQAAE